MFPGNSSNRPKQRPVKIGSTTNGTDTDQRTKKRRLLRNIFRGTFFCIVTAAIAILLVCFIAVLNLKRATTSTSTTTTTERAAILERPPYRRNVDHRHVDHHNADSLSTLTCLTDQCIKQVASTMARAFPIRTSKSSWCSNTVEEENDTKESGLILIKVTKAASSTSAGVVIRIATRHSCTKYQWKHRFANEVSYKSQTSFLVTTVREPASRAVSTVFFHTLSRQKSGMDFKVTDEIVLKQLQNTVHNHSGATSAGQGGFQLRYIYPYGSISPYSAWSPDLPEKVDNAKDIMEHVRQTIDAYDFIILPERMDESLVALAILLQIDVGDVLVTSSKVAGTSQYQLLHPNKRTFYCLPTLKSHVTPTVSQFLHSDHWRAMNYGDYLLYEAAQQSLDRTIHDTIGKERFDRTLQRYRTLQQLEQTYCAPNVQFPCSNNGTTQLNTAKHNCYLFYYDFGCGYPCIDKIIQQYDNGTLPAATTT